MGRNLIAYWPLVLTILTVFFAAQIIDNYNAASFRYDDTIFLNVADNLRKGNGFSLSLNFPVSTFNIDTQEYYENTYAKNIIKEYPDQIRPYSKAPIYFILLASFFSITSANPENWVFLGAVLAIVTSVLFVNVYYFLIKRYFGIHISIISSLIIVSSFPFLGNVTVAEPRQLSFLLIVASLFFLKPNKIHYILFGVFAALANLTSQIGFLLIFGYGVYLLLHKEFKGLIIVVGIWFLITLPWMVRQFQTSGDFGNGLGIPFTKEISSIFTADDSIGSTFSSNITHVNVPSPFEMLSAIFISNNWHLELAIIMTFFSPIVYFSLRKNILSNKKNILFVILIIIIILFSVETVKTLEISKQNIIILEFLVIIGIPAFVYLTICRKNYQNRVEVIFLLLFFALILINYFASTIVGGLYYPLVFTLLFLALPVGIKGIKTILDKINSKNYKPVMLFAGLFLFVVIVSALNVPEYLRWYDNYSNWGNISAFDNIAYKWINNHKNENTVVMAEYPGLTFIRTGTPTVVIPSEFYVYDYKTIFNYIEYYQVNYIIKEYDRIGLWKYFGIDEVLRSGDVTVLKVNKLENYLVDLRIELIESSQYSRETMIFLSTLKEPTTDEEFIDSYNKVISFTENRELVTDADVRKMYQLKNGFLLELINSDKEADRNSFEQLLMESYKKEIEFYEESDYNDKLRVYEKIIIYDRINKEAWLAKAETLEKMGKNARSIAAYNFLLKLVDEEQYIEILEKIEDIKEKN